MFLRGGVFYLLLLLTTNVLLGQCNQIYNWTVWQNFTATSASGTINNNGQNIGVTMSANYNFNSTPGIYNYGAFNGFPGNMAPNATVPRTTWAAGTGGETTMCFSEPVTNPVLLIASLGNSGNHVTLQFSLPYAVVFDGGGMNYINNTTLYGYEGYAVIVFPGTFTCVTIYSSTPEYYTNITWGLNPPLFPVEIVGDSIACDSVVLTAQGGNNYNWSGGTNPNQATNTFLETGHYFLTVTDNNGCIVQTSVQVVVGQPTSDSLDVEICEGEFFSFEGENISSPGTYIKKLVNSQMCDSTIVLSLVVHKNYELYIDTFLCNGSIIEFNGDIWEPGKTYTYYLKTRVGCDSIMHFNVLALNSYYKAHDTIICEGNGIYLGDEWINQAGTFIKALQTLEGCDSIIQYNVQLKACNCCIRYDSSEIKESLINTFYPVAYNYTATKGSQEIRLDAVPEKDIYGLSYGNIPIRKGDLLLVIQMQGATFDTQNNASYGSGKDTEGTDNLGGTGYLDLKNAGKFEYVFALNDVPLTGGILKLASECLEAGLKETYYNSGENDSEIIQRFQVIRVPQYKSLQLQKNIISTAWNGRIGGVIALNVLDTLDLNNWQIDASYNGFRGGFVPFKPSNNSVYVHATDNPNLSGGKGEGICGTPRYVWNGINPVDLGSTWIGYQNGNYGKGAPGNAGGGGNNHNAGGGGGGLGGYGGLGGNAWAGAGSNLRTGGRPGSKIPGDKERLFLGGGGGGGDVNNTPNGNKGGVGGGIILLNAKYIHGKGNILANGSPGESGIGDGAGGGGSGGTIVLDINYVPENAQITIKSNGGNGGNTINGFNDHHGPGGGGSGGIIMLRKTYPNIATEVSPGESGKSMGNGSTNGATKGEKGEILGFSASKTFQYLPKPEAVFLSADNCTETTIQIENTSYINEAFQSKIIKYEWDFGDGRKSQEINPLIQYSNPGKYKINLIVTSNYDCRDTFSRFITISAPFKDTIEAEVCEPYLWNGQLYTVPGIYAFQGISSTGCDSMVTLILSFVQPDTTRFKIETCDNYSWNNLTLKESGQYQFKGKKLNGCDSIFVLDLKILESTSSYQKVNSCSDYTWNGITYTQTGIYTFKTTNHVGCDSIATLDLTILSPSNSFLAITSCEKFLWNTTEYTQSGIYTFKTTNHLGCDSVATLALTINYPSFSQTMVESCDSFSWNGTNYTQTGTYNFLTSNTRGCDSLATLFLTIKKSTTSLQYMNSCDVYLWNGTEYKQSGTYLYQTTNAQGCDSIATLLLTIHPSKTTQIYEVACTSFFWKDNTYTSSGIYRYLEQTVYGCDSMLILNLTIHTADSITHIEEACDEFYWHINKTLYKQSGVYADSFQNIFGCDSVHQLFLTINPSYHLIDSVVAIDEYLWLKNGKSYDASAIDSIISASQFGCDSIWTLKLNLKYSKKVFIPNIINSNAPGTNKYFTVYGNQSLSIIEALKVYDRWGNLIYDGKNIPPGIPETGWNGSFSGIPVAEGVYIYIATIRFTDNTREIFSGDVTVIR